MIRATKSGIRIAGLLSLAVATTAVPGTAAAPPLDNFQLQPGASATPTAQGPTEQGAPPPKQLAPEASSTPTASALPPGFAPNSDTNAPPTAAASPLPVSRPASDVNQPPASAKTPAPRPTPQPSRAAEPQPAATPTAVASPTPAPEPAESASASPTPAASEPALAAPTIDAASIPFSPAPEEERGATGWSPQLLLLGLLGLLLAAGAAIFFWRRKRAEAPAPTPATEEPRTAKGETAAEPKLADRQMDLPLAPEAEPSAEDEPLSVALEARQLSITLTSATLAYRITLTNNGRTRLNGLAITGDLISAHASVPSETQLAGPDTGLVPDHEIASLAAGETTQVTGEFRLPFTLIEPIRKNSAVLFVPLARVRVEAQRGNGNAKLTALVGQRSREPGGGLQPFRLDLGPRIYREVTQRIFS